MTDIPENETRRRLIYGQATHVGEVRSSNQDAVWSFVHLSDSADEQPDFALFVVADGMGGHQNGEQASAIAVRLIASGVIESLYMPLLEQQEDRQPVLEALSETITRANKVVKENAQGGGSTATAAVLINDMIHVAHVGDSRAYLIQDSGIEQISEDHDILTRLIALGQVAPEDAPGHAAGHKLYRALGMSDVLEVDTYRRRLTDNARLLLCSDGLWNMVPDTSIQEYVLHSPTPQDAAQRLVDLANARGGQDNISVIVIQRK